MKLLLTLITLCLCLASCSDSGGAKSVTPGIEISYFAKDFYTYINSNGWLLRRGGLSDDGLHYVVSRGDVSVEIVMDYDSKTERASFLEFRYPYGDKDSELLLKDILDHIEGADDILRRVDIANK